MAVLLYLVLALIGTGPTLYLNRGKLRDAGTWLIAPVVGFMLMVIVATVLVQLQLPIEKWATPATVILCLLSLGLVGIWWSRRRGVDPLASLDEDSPAAGRQAAAWGGLALGVGGLLAVLPVLVGGWWFNHFRGNAGDASNYAVMAGALAHEPINWLLHSDLATLHGQSKHLRRSLDSAPGALDEQRVFGWAAELTPRMHLFDLEPQYYVLHLLLAIGPAYLLARRLGAGRAGPSWPRRWWGAVSGHSFSWTWPQCDSIPCRWCYCCWLSGPRRRKYPGILCTIAPPAGLDLLRFDAGLS